MDKVLALVLAAGRVDELLTLTERRPKSAVPVFGMYRVIDFVLSNMMHSGINVVGVLSQYRPFELMHHIGGGEHWDFSGRAREIRVLPPYRGMRASDWYKGTADAIYQNIGFIEEFNPENVLIASADHIYRMDYQAMYDFHKAKSADVTVCFTSVKKKEKRFGYGILDKKNRVVEYIEKPEKSVMDLASMTVYLFKTGVLINLLKENARNVSHEFGRDILPALTNSGKMFGYIFKGYWAYARTIPSYYKLHQDLLKREIDLEAWQIRTNLIDRCEYADRVPSRIDGQVKNSLISDGCIIKGRVVNSVLSPGVRVDEKASVQNSIIFHDCIIENGSLLDRVICDKDVIVSEKAQIGHFGHDVSSSEFGELLDTGITLIGKSIRIPETARIGSNTAIFSTAKIEQLNIEPGSTLR